MIKKHLIVWLTFLVFLGIALGPVIAGDNYNQRKLAGTSVLNNAQSFDVNRIDCILINNGLFANDPQTGHSGLEYPNGSGNLAVYTAGLWVLGVTSDTHELRAAAADYSTDFQPGIILDNGAPDDPTKSEYVVYKFNKGDVIPQVAIDQGCPEEVMGDQMVFCVYNDANPVNHQAVWQTQPIGLEVQQTVWGYAQAGPLGDCMFMKFKFINKGPVDLDSAYVAIFFDPDLGEATDDFVGCDTDLNLGFVYNGDSNDPYYGDQPPALGCDFFQGPMVSSPGDTAIIPAGVYPDMKILPMTAFFKYINSSSVYSDPTLQSAEGGSEAYNYCRGLVWDGSPFIDPTTGAPSKFVNSGDPVLGTGWLCSAESPPGDMRMGQSSGPFQLKRNEPLEVVVGIVVGGGTNYLNSVSIMKYNDKAAQFAYDNNFVVGSPPPAPKVEVFEGDQEVVLTWDDTAKDYSDAAGYAFEGYNIYQAPSEAGDAQGKWTLIAVYDKVNFITKIWDEAYDSESDAVVVKPVQFGGDNGLQYSMTISSDRLGGGTPLINGKNYYFAVTGYTFNPDGVPKALENVTKAIIAVPHKPELATQLNAETEEAIATEIVAKGDILVNVEVVDPSKITGDDYRVDFIFATSGDAAGYADRWKLTNVTSNMVILNNITNLSGDDDYPVAEGLVCKVIAPTPGAYGINTHVGDYASYGDPYGGFSIEGSRYLTGVNAGGNSFFAGLMLGEEFFGSTCTPDQIVDVRIDFVNDQSQWTNCAVYERPGYALKGVGTFPGAAFDIADPDNPRRLNLCFVEQVDSNAPDNHWDPIAADVGDDLGGREYLFIMASDYVEDPTSIYGDDDPYWGPGADVIYALWPAPREGHTSDEEFSMTIHALHPVKEGDHITFSTAGLEKETSNLIAKERLEKINVFPNPYFGLNLAETSNFDQKVTFINLPANSCTIRIFTLSGQLVKEIDHSNGMSIDNWDLHNEDNIPVASGMYIAYIEVPNVGDKILKLAVINREARYLHAPQPDPTRDLTGN